MNVNVQAQERGCYMHTANGKKYWPLSPRPEEVHIEVIAHHLAAKCRYAGAVRHPIDMRRIFYSVAEHSVYVALDLALQGHDDRMVAIGLLHDASEAYNGDLIRPLKYDPYFADPFKVVEERNERAICERFSLPYPFPAPVKASDEAVTAAEVKQIVPKSDDEEWESGRLHDDHRIAPFTIKMLGPFEARAMFLELMNRLADDTVPRTVEEIGAFLAQFR